MIHKNNDGTFMLQIHPAVYWDEEQDEPVVSVFSLTEKTAAPLFEVPLRECILNIIERETVISPEQYEYEVKLIQHLKQTVEMYEKFLNNIKVENEEYGEQKYLPI